MTQSMVDDSALPFNPWDVGLQKMLSDMRAELANPSRNPDKAAEPEPPEAVR